MLMIACENIKNVVRRHVAVYFKFIFTSLSFFPTHEIMKFKLLKSLLARVSFSSLSIVTDGTSKSKHVFRVDKICIL